MIRKEVVLGNPDGLQARPAALLVKIACRYPCRVVLEMNDKVINAKSMMGVLSLGVGIDQKIAVVAEGPEEKEACEALVRLMESGFQESAL